MEKDWTIENWVKVVDVNLNGMFKFAKETGKSYV